MAWERARTLDRLVVALPHAEIYPAGLGGVRGGALSAQLVRQIQSDSRQVQPGDLFVAIPGTAADGHRYVGAALKAGAIACVVEHAVPELEAAPTIIVPNAREALAYLHAAWHGFPAYQLRVIGVTGTDGKTTTTRLISAMLRAAGYRVGTIDTISATIGENEVPTGFHTTTPDAPEVQAYLAEMVAAGMQYAVIESTSHGLAQYRVAACAYDVAVVTNITHEHLDYHGTYEAYRAAKAMLFHALNDSPHKPGMGKVAVLNADDSSYAYLREIPAERQIVYGLASEAEITASDIVAGPDGLSFTTHMAGADLAVRSPLLGRYNVSNILAAISAAHSQGVSAKAILEGIAQVRGVLGRMERIALGQPFTAIVDFAHTPNALDVALKTLRELAEGAAVPGQPRGRVIVVFGCAGLRDRAKRPWMGRVAGQLADITVITAEDPRTESLDEIMEQIAVGCREAGAREGAEFHRVGDRQAAIDTALGLAAPGDIVVVTGKGHERSMCFGTTEYPWSDQDAVIAGLNRLGYR